MATALLVARPPAARGDCSVAANAQNAAPGTTSNCYNRITRNGSIAATYPDCFYQISQSIWQLDAWLAATVPQMPVYHPFRNADVGTITGWMYNDTNRHNAVDYGRGGSTFRVDAVADGKVVWVGWMSSPGNVVIVEHTAAGGQKFRAIYHHLRNGRDNDIAYARATRAFYTTNVGAWPPSDGAWAFYQTLADNDYTTLNTSPTPDQLAAIESRWGTNADTLMVSVGQTVKAGQQVGWAGMSGVHGANSNYQNTHLHLMFARQAWHPVSGSWQFLWTFFDPYGLYALPVSCYQTAYPSGSGDRQHWSHFAPFFQDFVDLDWTQFQSGFDYFASFGWFPAVLATEASGWTWKMGGSFQPNPLSPVVRHMQTSAQLQADFDYWTVRGWRTDRVVGMPAPDQPRYTSIYAPIHNTGFVARHQITASQFNQEFQYWYPRGYLLTDFSVYPQWGQLYFTVNWVQESNPGYAMYYGLTASDFYNRDSEFTSQGLQLVHVVKYFHPGLGDRYAGLWHYTSETLASYLDLTASDFRAFRDWYDDFGWKIKRVSAYNGRYAVIFAAPPPVVSGTVSTSDVAR